jgi:hypothetical protein
MPKRLLNIPAEESPIIDMQQRAGISRYCSVYMLVQLQFPSQLSLFWGTRGGGFG